MRRFHRSVPHADLCADTPRFAWLPKPMMACVLYGRRRQPAKAERMTLVVFALPSNSGKRIGFANKDTSSFTGFLCLTNHARLRLSRQISCLLCFIFIKGMPGFLPVGQSSHVCFHPSTCSLLCPVFFGVGTIVSFCPRELQPKLPCPPLYPV
jgi:hypothetical protein